MPLHLMNQRKVGFAVAWRGLHKEGLAYPQGRITGGGEMQGNPLYRSVSVSQIGFLQRPVYVEGTPEEGHWVSLSGVTGLVQVAQRAAASIADHRLEKQP